VDASFVMEKLDCLKQSSFLTLSNSFDGYCCLGRDAELGGSSTPLLTFGRTLRLASSMEKMNAAIVFGIAGRSRGIYMPDCFHRQGAARFPPIGKRCLPAKQLNHMFLHGWIGCRGADGIG
jgi:hypothetical protein